MRTIQNFTQLHGTARIFARKVKTQKNTFTAYSVGISKKDEDGDYQNAYLDVILSQKATAALKKIKPTKTKAGGFYEVIMEGWLTVKTRGTGDEARTFPAVFINKLKADDHADETDDEDDVDEDDEDEDDEDELVELDDDEELPF